MIDTAVILAGGRARRLKKITKNIPKSLVKFNKKPFLYYKLKLLKKNKIKNVIICTGHYSDQIEKYVKTIKLQMNILISKDGNKPLGTGGALSKVINKFKKSFFLIYGDSYLPTNFQKISRFFEENSFDVMIAAYKNLNSLDRSNILINNNHLYYEKNIKNKNFEYIDYGLSIFGKNAKKYLPKKKVFDLSDFFHYLSKKKLLSFTIVKERFYEIGSFKGISDFKKYLKK